MRTHQPSPIADDEIEMIAGHERDEQRCPQADVAPLTDPGDTKGG